MDIQHKISTENTILLFYLQVIQGQKHDKVEDLLNIILKNAIGEYAYSRAIDTSTGNVLVKMLTENELSLAIENEADLIGFIQDFHQFIMDKKYH